MFTGPEFWEFFLQQRHLTFKIHFYINVAGFCHISWGFRPWADHEVRNSYWCDHLYFSKLLSYSFVCWLICPSSYRIYIVKKWITALREWFLDWLTLYFYYNLTFNVDRSLGRSVTINRIICTLKINTLWLARVPCKLLLFLRNKYTCF